MEDRHDAVSGADGGVRLLIHAVRAIALLAALATSGIAGAAVREEEPSSSGTSRFRFEDVAAASGMTRVLLAGRPGKDHLLDSAGAGAAWLDYDGDGDLDAYVVNGWRIDGGRIVERGLNALYRNRGDGTFDDVTDRAGVGGEGHWGSGLAVADYDSDGWPDLLVTNYGANVLYRNRGDGTFENVAAAAGVESPGWNTGAAFLDADGDGDLDLYIAAYIDAPLEEVLGAKPTLRWKGVAMVAVGPFGLTGASDHFFRNLGDGTFVEATEAAGLTDKGRGYGFAVRAAFLDADDLPDLYVANDSDPNYQYRNRGDGTFEEIGLWSGSALSASGAAQAGMGTTVGDPDGDGDADLFVTNFQQDYSTLYLGDGGGFFEDATEAWGLVAPTYGRLSWGTAFVDLDADGDQDLVVANGHIYPQVDEHPELGQTYAQSNLLLENTGGGRFVDVSQAAGPGFALVQSSRGLAAGDADGDGDLDLLITNLDEAPALLRNDSRSGTWMRLAILTDRGAPAVGARAWVRCGERSQWRDLSSSDSFLSVHDPRLHFGLGEATVADRVEVRWPGGARVAFRGLPADRFYVVRPPAGVPPAGHIE